MAKPVALPLTISVLLHLSVLALLVFNFAFSTPPPIVPQPKIIEAKLVSMEQLPALRAKPQPVTEAEPAPVDTPKPEPEKPEPVKVEPPKPEPKKPEPPKPDLEKQKQVEKQKELEKQIQIEKEKAELQQKKIAEQKKQEAERKRKEADEAQRKKQQEEAQEDLARKKREQQERNELAKAMAAEDNAMAAERDQEAVASFAGMIQRDIQNSWSRPPSARIGMHVTLLIQLIPSGDVINVSVLKSSGNDAFDQSAVSAVRRVGKFAYLKELSDKSPATFDKQFRRLQLDFSPEDLRQ